MHKAQKLLFKNMIINNIEIIIISNIENIIINKLAQKKYFSDESTWLIKLTVN